MEKDFKQWKGKQCENIFHVIEEKCRKMWKDVSFECYASGFGARLSDNCTIEHQTRVKAPFREDFIAQFKGKREKTAKEHCSKYKEL